MEMLQLPYKESNGVETPKDVYLDYTKKQIPVPKFFFKVVLDEKAKQGVVFIGG